MSYRHYVTVASDELARLRNAEQARRALGTDVVNQVQTAMQRTRQDVGTRLGRTDSRLQDLDRSVSGLNEGIHGFESEVSNQLRSQAQATRAAIDQTYESWRQTRGDLLNQLGEMSRQMQDANEETRRALHREIRDTERKLQETMHEQGQQLHKEIAAEREQRHRQVRRLQAQITQIHQDKSRLREEAQGWIQAADTKRGFILSQYPLSEGDQQALNKQETAIQLASQNLTTKGAEQAALSGAQAAWLDLTQLVFELEAKEREWHILREEALLSARTLLAEAQANRKLNERQVGRQIRDEISEVDYWTEGKLTEFTKEIGEIAASLEKDESGARLSLDQLRAMASQQLPQAEARLGEIIDKAVRAIIRSQIRMSVADLAMQALKEHNYGVEGGVYEGDDYRGAVVAKAKALDASEVIISVVPDGEQDRMEINYDEKTQRSPEELMRRSQEVQQSMQRKGLEVPISDVHHVDGPADLANRDLDEVRRRTKSKEQVQTRPATKKT